MKPAASSIDTPALTPYATTIAASGTVTSINTLRNTWRKRSAPPARRRRGGTGFRGAAGFRGAWNVVVCPGRVPAAGRAGGDTGREITEPEAVLAPGGDTGREAEGDTGREAASGRRTG